MSKKIRTREEIDDKYKWRLEDMFASDEAWEQELESTLQLAKEYAALKGTLADSGENLLKALKMYDKVSYHASRLYVYANMRMHQDTSVAKYQGYAAKADAMSVEVSSATSYTSPEILAIDEEKLNNFYEEEKGLEHYRRFLDEILRGKKHTRSAEVEEVLSQAGDLAIAPDKIYSMFDNADIKFPYIRDVEGNHIRITHGNFTSLLESQDRSLRKEVFEGVYNTYKAHGNSVAEMLISNLRQENFFAKVRNYESVRAMHLDSGNIPESVYDNLIETVHKHLPAMHKYMAIRKKMLGVNELHMYDLYVPLVDNLDKKYTYEDSKEIVKKAIAPMGEEYVKIAADGMDKDWVDVYENENKRSGAYSWGTYGTHPYVLLNHQDTLDSMFTLAHEMGHAMHSYYSKKNQPYTYADYLIFLAEVASTCNEALLLDYLMKTTTDADESKYLVNHQLEEFRTTVFRQTMFAEFEKIIYDRLKAGEELTKESICKIYHDLNVMYYGPDMVVDEEIDYEWMRIPHFYTAFYVYQYATGYSAAMAFSKKILEEGDEAVERYISKFLSTGCSKDPIDILKEAGVDMSTPAPIDDALKVFEHYVDVFEKM